MGKMKQRKKKEKKKKEKAITNRLSRQGKNASNHHTSKETMFRLLLMSPAPAR